MEEFFLKFFFFSNLFLSFTSFTSDSQLLILFHPPTLGFQLPSFQPLVQDSLSSFNRLLIRSSFETIQNSSIFFHKLLDHLSTNTHFTTHPPNHPTPTHLFKRPSPPTHLFKRPSPPTHPHLVEGAVDFLVAT